MTDSPNLVITKTDFLNYLTAPRHLWAIKHNRIESTPTDFDQLIAAQAYAVEDLARKYLEQAILTQDPALSLIWQPTYRDGYFQCRSDALIQNTSKNTNDLFEIKSSTSVDKENLFDLAFQALILRSHLSVDHYYLLHLNKDYILAGDLDLTQLFTVEDATATVLDLLPGIDEQRQAAYLAATAADPDSLGHCLSPSDCPCPSVCHPDLPEFSIYDIPRLSSKKKKELLDLGVTAAKDIPVTIDLNAKQWLIVERARTQSVLLDRAGLQTELARITFPVYFLDYETCICAVPRYPGYHAQQQVVFQYSLHRLDEPGSEPVHSEHLSISREDPSLPLLQHLSQEIGDQGTVIVWNKAFEQTRNREMALLHPKFAAFLEDVNNRIYDLGDIVNLGLYLHPGFKGSWSIKKVLSVMKPDLSYDDLEINKGDQASMTWWTLAFGDLPAEEIERLGESLRRYCELDTRAMVELYKGFLSMI